MAAISDSFSLKICFIHLLLSLSPNQANAGGGFTVELIHRDSPQSPFYNPTATQLDRLTKALERSLSRVKQFSLSKTNIQSPIFPSAGEYLMTLAIGTPPIKVIGIVDTGSDLSWTQCQPCTKCYRQTSPLFHPKKSSTYKELSCKSRSCVAVGSSSCTGKNNICEYRYAYADKSYTFGDVAVETFTFGSPSGRPVSISNIVFGCGHNQAGLYDKAATGIIGLGGGSISLVNQLGNSINGKFSYCFATSPKFKSKISFGHDAVVSGSGVVSTPIAIKGRFNYYYLTLESIIVGNKSLGYETKIPSGTKSAYPGGGGEGNIIIDSGTTYTFLPSGIFTNLKSQLNKFIKAKPRKDPHGVFQLCYSDDNIDDYPTLTFKFRGANVELPATKTFFVVGELICLIMIPTDDVAVFGNLSQMNLWIGFDLVKKQISFKPTDCSKQ